MSVVHKVFCLNIYTLFFLASFAGFQNLASTDANKSKSLEIQARGFKLSFVPVDIKQGGFLVFCFCFFPILFP